MGISVPTSFVPPVHTPSASEALKRSHAPRKNPCRLQLLFVPESSLTYRWHQMVLNMSADASPALSGGGLYRSEVICSAMGLDLPESSPAPEQVAGNPAGFWNDFYYCWSLPGRQARIPRPNYTVAFPVSGRTISFSIRSASNWTPFFRIVNMILSNLQAITISDCIFFSGLIGLVV